MSETLRGILATEISPELVPAEDGEKPQSTEAKIGPYALQDFNLYYVLRFGFRPSKIAFLSLQAWEDAARGDWPPGFPESRRVAYSLAEIRFWLQHIFTPLLRLQPVQALGDAEWPESVGWRLAVATRRLARAVGRQCPRMDCRVGRERARKLKQRKPDATT